MESALLIFAALARYVMGVLTQYMGTLHGVLQVSRLAGWLYTYLPVHLPCTMTTAVKRFSVACKGAEMLGDLLLASLAASAHSRRGCRLRRPPAAAMPGP